MSVPAVDSLRLYPRRRCRRPPDSRVRRGGAPLRPDLVRTTAGSAAAGSFSVALSAFSISRSDSPSRAQRSTARRRRGTHTSGESAAHPGLTALCMQWLAGRGPILPVARGSTRYILTLTLAIGSANAAQARSQSMADMSAPLKKSVSAPAKNFYPFSPLPLLRLHITGSPVQVKVATAPSGFGQGTFSQGAFANGNVIMGIGLKMKDNNASAIGTTFLNFGIGTDNCRAASSLGGTDGRTDNNVWARTGDFGMWMSAASGGTGPLNLYAMTTNGAAYAGAGQYSNLPGGFGSGVSYDYAARIFRQGGAGGSIQFLFGS